MSNESIQPNGDHPSDSRATEFEVLQKVIAALTPLSEEARRRILESAALFLRIDSRPRHLSPPSHESDFRSFPSPASRSPFSEDTSMSPKDFLLEKQPRTDVERIASLAYYLTHYRGTAHFKTVDLSMLNTEAAQPKFANTAYSSNNAVKLGYLVPSTKGQRQLSAIGERFVRALPDRDAAKAALESIRRRSRTKRPKKNSTVGEG
jgi:hypothetical protein